MRTATDVGPLGDRARQHARPVERTQAVDRRWTGPEQPEERGRAGAAPLERLERFERVELGGRELARLLDRARDQLERLGGPGELARAPTPRRGSVR